MNGLEYAILVEPRPAADGGGFTAIVPDLPGCMKYRRHAGGSACQGAGSNRSLDREREKQRPARSQTITSSHGDLGGPQDGVTAGRRFARNEHSRSRE